MELPQKIPADYYEALEWQKALENKRQLDRLERALGNPDPVFAYTDSLPPPKKKV